MLALWALLAAVVAALLVALAFLLDSLYGSSAAPPTPTPTPPAAQSAAVEAAELRIEPQVSFTGAAGARRLVASWVNDPGSTGRKPALTLRDETGAVVLEGGTATTGAASSRVERVTRQLAAGRRLELVDAGGTRRGAVTVGAAEATAMADVLLAGDTPLDAAVSDDGTVACVLATGGRLLVYELGGGDESDRVLFELDVGADARYCSMSGNGKTIAVVDPVAKTLLTLDDLYGGWAYATRSATAAAAVARQPQQQARLQYQVRSGVYESRVALDYEGVHGLFRVIDSADSRLAEVHACNRDNVLRVWTSQSLGSSDEPLGQPATHAVMSSDGRMAAVFSSDGLYGAYVRPSSTWVQAAGAPSDAVGMDRQTGALYRAGALADGALPLTEAAFGGDLSSPAWTDGATTSLPVPHGALDPGVASAWRPTLVLNDGATCAALACPTLDSSSHAGVSALAHADDTSRPESGAVVVCSRAAGADSWSVEGVLGGGEAGDHLGAVVELAAGAEGRTLVVLSDTSATIL